ncbi:MAG: asparagine synthase C-terminal domain-containing protein, partial [Flavobacteriales bacterium]|nr:asparagine synthase C-terminal domain-containing protein [Flavobacteriales bacterium]
LGKSESAINRQILMSKITSRFKKGQTNYGVYKDVLGAGDKGHLFRRGMAFSDQDLSSIWSQKSNYKPAFIEEYLNTIWRENKENRVADSIFKGSFKTRLLNDYLVKVDRMSMNNSLEVRSPFLDIDFAQKMLQLPNDYKLRNETPKFILKKLAEKWLADDIMKRPKKGFAIPVNDWLKDQLKDKVEYYLDPERVQKHGLFNTDFIKNVKTEFYQSNQVSNYKIWTLICLSIWSENNL